MLHINGIIGNRNDPAFREKVHELEHKGFVDFLVLSHTDMARHRLRAVTEKGTECAVALPRSEHLSNGAVLHFEENLAVIVQMKDVQWLTLKPRDIGAALELGHRTGNLHWKAEFRDECLRVALNGSVQSYLDRIEDLIRDGRVERINNE